VFHFILATGFCCLIYINTTNNMYCIKMYSNSFSTASDFKLQCLYRKSYFLDCLMMKNAYFPLLMDLSALGISSNEGL